MLTLIPFRMSPKLFQISNNKQIDTNTMPCNIFIVFITKNYYNYIILIF